MSGVPKPHLPNNNNQYAYITGNKYSIRPDKNIPSEKKDLPIIKSIEVYIYQIRNFNTIRIKEIMEGIDKSFNMQLNKDMTKVTITNVPLDVLCLICVTDMNIFEHVKDCYNNCIWIRNFFENTPCPDHEKNIKEKKANLLKETDKEKRAKLLAEIKVNLLAEIYYLRKNACNKQITTKETERPTQPQPKRPQQTKTTRKRPQQTKTTRKRPRKRRPTPVASTEPPEWQNKLEKLINKINPIINTSPVRISDRIRNNGYDDNDYEAIKGYFTECNSNNETNKNCEMTYEHVFTDFILQLQEIQLQGIRKNNWGSGMRCIKNLVNDVTSYIALLSLVPATYLIAKQLLLITEIKSLNDNIIMENRLNPKITQLQKLLKTNQENKQTIASFIFRFESARNTNEKEYVIRDVGNKIDKLLKEQKNSYHREVHLYF